MSGPALCRWYLTLAPASPEIGLPAAEKIVGVLRKLVPKDELRVVEVATASLAMLLEGTWPGFRQLFESVRSGQLSQHLGCEVRRFEPAFTPDFIARIKARDREAMAMFVQVYGPLVKLAISRVWAKIPQSRNLPSPDELLPEIWTRLMGKIEGVLAKVDPAKGSQYAYLYTTVSHLIYDFLREERKIKEMPSDSEQMQRIGDPSDLRRLLESRDLLARLLRAFEAHCQSHKQRVVPNDWELFNLHFLEEIPKEELCRRFRMTSNNFDVRIRRIRQQLKDVAQRLGS